MTNEAPKITVITITDSREIPAVPGGKLLSATYIVIAEKAKSWAREEGILTVYWHSGIECAFGYVGK